jgi:hypothetical protein
MLMQSGSVIFLDAVVVLVPIIVVPLLGPADCAADAADACAYGRTGADAATLAAGDNAADDATLSARTRALEAARP